LSRNPVLEANENEDEQLKIENMIKVEDIITHQEKNNEVQQLKNRLVSNHNIYYKRKKNISEKFSIEFIKNIHKNMYQL